MSDEILATYAFLPWLRRGTSTGITRVDGDTDAATPRAQVNISIEVDPVGSADPASILMQLHGPGEVGGIDQRVIIRTYPQPNEIDAEPNYFVAIDFDQPDFPWRYTPARANEQDRLRPWLVLVVLTDNEIAESTPGGTDGRLPTIVVTNAASLPILSQSWAWAHTQISGVAESETGDISNIINNEPERCIARLLCSRRLLPRTRYTAYLVPALERGRKAGLNERITLDTDGLQPAWTDDESNVRLPVYYQWQFQTGVRGDFEYLARQLRARVTPPNIGKKAMDVASPGLGLPLASTRPLEIEGALTSPQTTTTPWEAAEKQIFVTELKKVVDAPTDLLNDGNGQRSIAPPLYGRWYAAKDRLKPAQVPRWFNGINEDPRLRSACGLGTQAIQKEQQALMASAWEQMDELRELQEDYINAQMAREITETFNARHIFSHNTETILMITGPVHARVLTTTSTGQDVKTIYKTFKQSPIVKGVGDPQFRRISRLKGPISKRQGRTDPLVTPTLLERLNQGNIDPAPQPETAEEIATVSNTASKLAPAWLTLGLLDSLRCVPWLLLIALLVFIIFAFVVGIPGVPTSIASAIIAAIGVASGVVRWWLRRLRLRLGMRDGNLKPEDIAATRPPSNFVPLEAAPNSHLPPRGLVDVPRELRTQMANNFKTALADLYRDLNTPVLPGAKLIPASFANLKNDLELKLNPDSTIVSPLKARTLIAPWVRWQFDEDPIEPPMPAPVFDQSMYKPLRDISSEWILPGAGEIPNDTVSLLISNQKFIESYMLGCNHEMTREFTYHELRIDQRATYFQYFWESIEIPGETPPLEEMKDIKRIHVWDKDKGPGNNSARRPPPDGEHLVLIIRGELFKRYPNTIVYASKARIGGPEDGENNGKRIPDSEEKPPVFQGRLDPDIHFFGFELGQTEVRGIEDDDSDTGWFFILEEQISEPRFGLDVPGTYNRQIVDWDDLAWSDLVSGPDEVDQIGYINLDNDLPDTSDVVTDPDEPQVAWHANSGLGNIGARASDIAYITQQKPFRVAIHGSDMLPSEER